MTIKDLLSIPRSEEHIAKAVNAFFKTCHIAPKNRIEHKICLVLLAPYAKIFAIPNPSYDEFYNRIRIYENGSMVVFGGKDERNERSLAEFIKFIEEWRPNSSTVKVADSKDGNVVITMSISKEEALALHAAFCLFGGNRNTTYRGLTDKIQDALFKHLKLDSSDVTNSHEFFESAVYPIFNDNFSKR